VVPFSSPRCVHALPLAPSHTLHLPPKNPSFALLVLSPFALPTGRSHPCRAALTLAPQQLAIPHLLDSVSQGRNPHILTLAPPLRGNLEPAMLGPSTAYAMAKFGMSLATVGLAGELRGKVGVNGACAVSLEKSSSRRSSRG